VVDIARGERTDCTSALLSVPSPFLRGHDEIQNVGEDGGDAVGVERTDCERVGRHAFGAAFLERFVELQLVH
jgi:hypothetical protein